MYYLDEGKPNSLICCRIEAISRDVRVMAVGKLAHWNFGWYIPSILTVNRWGKRRDHE
jgi:hypothetical protein